MEDAHIAVSLDDIHNVTTLGDDDDDDPATPAALPDHYLLGVFDGHGGSFAAHFVADHFVSVLFQQASFQEYVMIVQEQQQQRQKRITTTEKDDPDDDNDKKDDNDHDDRMMVVGSLLQRALEDAFVQIDLDLLRVMVHEGRFHIHPPNNHHHETTKQPSTNDNAHMQGDDWEVSDVDPELESLPVSSSTTEVNDQDERMTCASGTTATVVLVTPEWIICANVGDSRTVLDAKALSQDHKPNLPHERTRILNANGNTYWGRVDGQLAVSRALGDYEFKSYETHHLSPDYFTTTSTKEDHRTFCQSRLKVSCFPDVTCHTRKASSKPHSCLILACDGIWDVISDWEANYWIQQRLLLATEEAAATTKHHPSPPDLGRIAEDLLDECLARKSRDNMTLIVCLLPSPPAPAPTHV